MDLSWLDQLLAAYVVVPASWTVTLAATAGAVVTGALAYGGAFRALQRLTASTRTQLDDVLVRRMRGPARVLVGVGALHVLLALRGASHAGFLAGVIVVELLLVAFLCIEAAETLFFHYWLGERQQVPVPAVVRHLVLVVLYTAVGLSVLGTVTGLNLVPVLATSTVVTVVVGLALQDTLGNLFSGLALHAEHPFKLGDWVLIDGVEGLVVHIGWRSTHLRTLSGDLVALPNSGIARTRIQNFYLPERTTARLLEVPVSLVASPEQVERAVGRACANVARVLDDPPPRVWLVATTPLFIRYTVKIWIGDFQFHDDIESDLMKAIWHALQEEGIALALAPAGLDGEEQVVAAARPRA